MSSGRCGIRRSSTVPSSAHCGCVGLLLTVRCRTQRAWRAISRGAVLDAAESALLASCIERWRPTLVTVRRTHLPNSEFPSEDSVHFKTGGHHARHSSSPDAPSLGRIQGGSPRGLHPPRRLGRQRGAGAWRPHGVSANLVHRWRRAAADRGHGRCGKGELAEFVPMKIAAAPVVAAPEDIRIELRRGACAVSIACPTSAATACAGWRIEARFKTESVY